MPRPPRWRGGARALLLQAGGVQLAQIDEAPRRRQPADPAGGAKAYDDGRHAAHIDLALPGHDAAVRRVIERESGANRVAQARDLGSKLAAEVAR